MALIADQVPKGKEQTRSMMKVPPEKQGQLDALVAAGKKVLFSQAGDAGVQQAMQSKGPVGDLIGQGVLGVLAIIWDRSNGSVPQDLLIPAGVLLVHEAGEYLEDLGRKVTDADLADGMAAFIEGLLQKVGVNIDQLPDAMGAQQQQPAEQEAPEMEDIDEEDDE